MSSGNYSANGDPGWTGSLMHKTALGVLDDLPESNLYNTPVRYLRAAAAGNVCFTLHGDDTADGAKKVTLPMIIGQEFGVFAIRKIWATGTTIAVGNLLGMQ